LPEKARLWLHVRRVTHTCRDEHSHDGVFFTSRHNWDFICLLQNF